jgi:Leucine-rich repeat (LRR) protein
MDDVVETSDGLTCSNTRLDGVPGRVFERGTCSKLTLVNNSLVTFPSDLENVPGLAELSITHNNIEDISEGVRGLCDLRKLKLCNNRITAVPDSVGNMKRLYSLSLSHNRITEVSPRVSELRNLRFLYLDNNNIRRVPRALEKLDNVLSLDLRNNPLEATDDSAGYGAESLRKIFKNTLILEDTDMHPYRETDPFRHMARRYFLNALVAAIICLIIGLIYLGISFAAKKYQ